MIQGVRPAHSSNPDPQEPWRYHCPECESLSLRYYNSSRGSTSNGHEPFAYCRECQARRYDLYDRKRRREVNVREI